MTKRIGIFGTSGMAREASDIADALGLSVVFVARDSAELATFAEHGDSIL
jgi:D-arabinose 1-dehydrogenase-like Zn-dependent alcohol dehydrogenase